MNEKGPNVAREDLTAARNERSAPVRSYIVRKENVVRNCHKWERKSLSDENRV